MHTTPCTGDLRGMIVIRSTMALDVGMPLPHSEAIEYEEREEAGYEADKERRPKSEEPDKPEAVPDFCLLLKAG